MPRQAGPEGESKGDKFKRLGNGRLHAIAQSLDGLASLTGPAYEFTKEHVDAMEKYLTEKVRDAMQPFRDRLAGKKPTTTNKTAIL